MISRKLQDQSELP